MNKQESGVDQLIQRIRKETIDKAHLERDEIIKKAHTEANAIIEQAVNESKRLVAETSAHIAQEKRKLSAELELAARDFSLKLAERLKEQLFFPSIRENIRITVKEPGFLKETLTRVITEYVKTNAGSLDIIVPKELRTTLATYFAAAIFDNLDKKCDVRLVDEDGVEGFVLIKRGEHYVWDFRAQTISEELVRLIEPSLRKYFSTTRATSFDTARSATV